LGLISEELLSLFNQKIALEVYNSQVYIKIYNYLSNIGLDKIANFFKKQSMGEIDHRNKFIEYVNERNCAIEILPVNSVEDTFNTLKNIAQLYVDREISTTAFIKSMAFNAFENEDLISYNFLMIMINEQQEEENLALSFQDMISNVGDNPNCWQIFNNTFSLG